MMLSDGIVMFIVLVLVGVCVFVCVQRALEKEESMEAVMLLNDGESDWNDDEKKESSSAHNGINTHNSNGDNLQGKYTSPAPLLLILR